MDYLTDLLPGLLVFALGLSMTVAPLTATVLADADESNAGIASGMNNAIARVASLIAIAAVGAVVASSYGASLRDDLGPAASRPAVSRAIDEGQAAAARARRGDRRAAAACALGWTRRR